MQREFASSRPLVIDSGAPFEGTSSIIVAGLPDQRIGKLIVRIDVDHSFDMDLTLTLIGPQGQRVTLVRERGQNRDNFRGTVFDDDAPLAIAAGRPPFAGSFRPEEPLSRFQDVLAEGDWRLDVRDSSRGDGGCLNAWALLLVTRDATAPQPRFQIDFRFLDALAAAQEQAFLDAAVRWQQIIVGGLPAVRTSQGIIEGLLIDVSVESIDGLQQVLADATPKEGRPITRLPAYGVMRFDRADLDRLQAKGSLPSVILHEMGHVLGIGTLWKPLQLLQDFDPDDPVFLGPAAMAEYARLIQADEPRPVPVENTGPRGTRGGHWREADFGDELMTGMLGSGFAHPLSRLTIASLQDLGYLVDLEAAEDFRLQLARAFGTGPPPGLRCTLQEVQFTILPEEALNVD